MKRIPSIRPLENIANTGTSVSGLGDIGGFAMAHIHIPSGWTGGTTFTWKASHDGSTFKTITKEDGTDLTSTVVADRWCVVPPEAMISYKWQATFTAVTREESGLILMAKS